MMIFSLLLSVAIPLLLGFIMAFFLWPGSRFVLYHLMAQLSISAGLGFGICSVIFFLWLLIFGSDKGFPVFEGALSLLSIAALPYVIKRRRPSLAGNRAEPLVKIDAGSYVLFCCALLMALLLFILVSLRAPYGEWDAWTIWNLRARFLFRGGVLWKSAFTNLLDWSHPDYPLLVPLSVAFGWETIGHETVAMPMVLGIIFVLSTIFLSFSSLTELRGPRQGLLAGLTLLGTPFLVRHGAAQYADVPLGFFFLSTIVLLAFYDRLPSKSRKILFLAGMAAGFSAWTKNEGILFLLVIVITRFLVMMRAGGWKTAVQETVAVSLGIIPVLLVIIYFKGEVAPPNDLISSQGVTTLRKLLDYSRYFQILRAYFIIGVKFTGGIIGLPLLILYLSLMGLKKGQETRVTAYTALITVSLMLTVYFFIHLVTPYDLAWHLEHSVDRLFLPLWPTAVFCFFLIMRTPEEASIGREEFDGSGFADVPGKLS
jgi:hypothetical protein